MSVQLTNGMFIDYAFVCDDVRREDNGKFIFIGAYANDIILGSFPATLVLRLVTRLLVPAPGHYECELRARIGDAEKLRLKFVTDSVDGTNETSASPAFAAEFKEPCSLTFEVRCGEQGEWEKLLEFPVIPLTPPS